MQRGRGGGLTRSMAGTAGHQAEEQGHKNYRERGGADHPADHAGADRVPARGTGAGRYRKRHHAEDEAQRRHDDRAEPQPRGFHRGIEDRQALAVSHGGELDDQNRVLRGKPDQRNQPDLEVEVVLEAAQVDRCDRAEQRKRHRGQHRER